MSATFKVQSGDGVVIQKEPDGAFFVIKTTTPTNSIGGFGKGCLWVNTGGGVGTTLYVNVGTNASTTWVNIA